MPSFSFQKEAGLNTIDLIFLFQDPIHFLVFAVNSAGISPPSDLITVHFSPNVASHNNFLGKYLERIVAFSHTTANTTSATSSSKPNDREDTSTTTRTTLHTLFWEWSHLILPKSPNNYQISIMFCFSTTFTCKVLKERERAVNRSFFYYVGCFQNHKLEALILYPKF